MSIINQDSCQADINRAWNHPESVLIWSRKSGKSGKSAERQAEYINCVTPRAMIALFARHKSESAWSSVTAKADFMFDLKRGHVTVQVPFKPKSSVQHGAKEVSEKLSPLRSTADPKGQPVLFPLFSTPVSVQKHDASKENLSAQAATQGDKDCDNPKPISPPIPDSISAPNASESSHFESRSLRWNPISAFAGLAAATTAAAEESVASLTAGVTPLHVDPVRRLRSPDIEQCRVEAAETDLFNESEAHTNTNDPKSQDRPSKFPTEVSLQRADTLSASSMANPAYPLFAARPADSAVFSPGSEYDQSWLVGGGTSIATPTPVRSLAAASSSSLSVASASPPKRRFSFLQEKPVVSPARKHRAKVLFEGDDRGPRKIPRLLLGR